MKRVPTLGNAKLRKLHDDLAKCRSLGEAKAVCRGACGESTVEATCQYIECRNCILGTSAITSWDEIIIPLKLHLTKGDEDNA